MLCESKMEGLCVPLLSYINLLLPSRIVLKRSALESFADYSGVSLLLPVAGVDDLGRRENVCSEW